MSLTEKLIHAGLKNICFLKEKHSQVEHLTISNLFLICQDVLLWAVSEHTSPTASCSFFPAKSAKSIKTISVCTGYIHSSCGRSLGTALIPPSTSMPYSSEWEKDTNPHWGRHWHKAMYTTASAQSLPTCCLLTSLVATADQYWCDPGCHGAITTIPWIVLLKPSILLPPALPSHGQQSAGSRVFVCLKSSPFPPAIWVTGSEEIHSSLRYGLSAHIAMDLGSINLTQFPASPNLFLTKFFSIWLLAFLFLHRNKPEHRKDAKYAQGTKEACTTHFREIWSQKYIVVALPLIKAENGNICFYWRIPPPKKNPTQNPTHLLNHTLAASMVAMAGYFTY